MIQWSLGGREGRTLVLSAQTSLDYRESQKTAKEVRRDAALIATMKRVAIDITSDRGELLATVHPGKGDE